MSRPALWPIIKEVRMASAQDPVCGMTIDPADAVETADHAGTTYYFCSKGCAESFRSAPEDHV